MIVIMQNNIMESGYIIILSVTAHVQAIHTTNKRRFRKLADFEMENASFIEKSLSE